MIILLNASKTLDFQTPSQISKCTQPELLNDAEYLVTKLRTFSEVEISGLMGLSQKLAAFTVERYANWKTPFTLSNAKQALLAFKGDVYSGIEIEKYTVKDFNFAQKHLRILAGLYGILRPLDLIQPYRLEMATKLVTDRGQNLYDFWGTRINAVLQKSMQQEKSGVLINLCSAEYLKSVLPKRLEADLITPVFKEYRDGSYRTVAIYAKKARGLMCNFIIKNHLTDVEALKGFNEQGYKFNKKISSETDWLFTRQA
jgi:cytoplasmic iron level regulating protein YaaA (DUF328/UPF0246 family)